MYIPPEAELDLVGLPGMVWQPFCPPFLFLNIILFIFSCAGSLLLSGLFSSCGKQGLLSSCSVRASHCGGFFCCGAQAIGHMGSIVGCSRALEHRFKNCGTRA